MGSEEHLWLRLGGLRGHSQLRLANRILNSCTRDEKARANFSFTTLCFYLCIDRVRMPLVTTDLRHNETGGWRRWQSLDGVGLGDSTGPNRNRDDSPADNPCRKR